MDCGASDVVDQIMRGTRATRTAHLSAGTAHLSAKTQELSLVTYHGRRVI